MKTDTISDEVILISKNNKSIIDTEADKITSQNIEQFRPDLKTINTTKYKLQELGFEVPSYSGVTLTILGKPELFEKIFNVNLTLSDSKLKGVGATVQSDKELTVKGSREKSHFSPSLRVLPIILHDGNHS